MQNMINPITQGLNGGMHGAKSLIITGLLRNSIKKRSFENMHLRKKRGWGGGWWG